MHNIYRIRTGFQRISLKKECEIFYENFVMIAYWNDNILDYQVKYKLINL